MSITTLASLDRHGYFGNREQETGRSPAKALSKLPRETAVIHLVGGYMSQSRFILIDGGTGKVLMQGKIKPDPPSPPPGGVTSGG